MMTQTMNLCETMCRIAISSTMITGTRVGNADEEIEERFQDAMIREGS